MSEKIDHSLARSFGYLELLAKQVVEGFITGLHKSPFHGFSVEFAEHRLYNKGESTRHIDWKLYARTEKLFVKRYEEETNLRCHLIIDRSSSMYYPEKKEGQQFSKIEFAIHAAASATYLMRKQRDAVGLSLFSDKIELHTPVRSNQAHHHFLFHEMEKVLNEKEYKMHATDVVKTLHEIAEKIHRRSLVMIFSDMFEDGNEEEIMGALQHLRHNKHEVIVFHVVDKKHEIDLDFKNRPYTFIDLEKGEKVKLNPSQIREKYQSMMEEKIKQLRLKCLNYRVDFVECDINKGLDQVLSQYLVKREKMV